MYRITAAYDLLMRYCSEYSFPLKREEAEAEGFDIYDPEDWWRVRFGQDPMWSGKKKGSAGRVVSRRAVKRFCLGM
jgi:hypothetical protein